MATVSKYLVLSKDIAGDVIARYVSKADLILLLQSDGNSIRTSLPTDGNLTDNLGSSSSIIFYGKLLLPTIRTNKTISSAYY